ncbi:MAG: hypothetical protein HOK80_07900 [Candidatus Cloacimonetes bacterium]|nr:hypothetical protein [Candidatus Cloacimonadota bacterium]
MMVLFKYMGDLGGEKDELASELMESKKTESKIKGEFKKAGLSENMLSNPVELLYGEVRIVEIGIEDSKYAQILSGLNNGEEILLPITSFGSDDKAEEDGRGMGMGGSFRGK